MIRAMTSLEFDDVVGAWDQADEAAINPTWSLDPAHASYWALGEQHAQDVAEIAPEGSKILDFGAGNGRVAIPLAKLGYNVLAVDSSPDKLDRLTRYARQQGATVATLKNDGRDLVKALGRRKVDVVVVYSVLIHHDFAGGEELVRALAGVLKKGGALVADWPTSDTPVERAGWTDVTYWEAGRQEAVAKAAGLERDGVAGGVPVWRKV